MLLNELDELVLLYFILFPKRIYSNFISIMESNLLKSKLPTRPLILIEYC